MISHVFGLLRSTGLDRYKCQMKITSKMHNEIPQKYVMRYLKNT